MNWLRKFMNELVTQILAEMDLLLSNKLHHFCAVTWFFKLFYHVLNGCIIFGMAVPPLDWLYHLQNGCIIFRVVVSSFERLYHLLRGCTVL